MTTRRRRALGLDGRGERIFAHRPYRALLLAILVSTSPFGWSEANTQVDSDAVAVVDGETITGTDFQQYLAGYLRSKLYHGGSPERVRELADEALQNLIADQLLARAAAEKGVEPDVEATASELAAIRERYSHQENWPEIEAQIPDIEKRIRTATQVRKLRESISQVENPTKEQVRAFYQSNPALFTQPASWDLGVILVNVPPSGTAADWIEARKKTEAALARIAAGEPFEEVAREVSTHGSASDGGALGVVHKGQIPTEAEAALEKISVGQLTEATWLLEGYSAFRLNARIPEQLQPFEKVRERAEKLYTQRESRRRWADFVEGLRAEAQIQTFDINHFVNTFVGRSE